MAKASLSLYVLLTSIVAVALRYYALWHNSAQVEPGPLRTGLEAKEDAYHEPLKILSYDPFIAYLPDFVSLAERNYLINMSAPLLSRSTVRYPNGSRLLSSLRTSSTAYLPSNDEVVASLAKRAAEFQGYLPAQDVDVQVTKYLEGQLFKPHYDWTRQPNSTTNRLSTFFAILDASCQNCGTQFPYVRIDWEKRDPQWCEIVDCTLKTLTTRNIPGSAFFWQNLHINGTGRRDVLHAGLPAKNGTKIGLNIWTTVPLERFK